MNFSTYRSGENVMRGFCVSLMLIFGGALSLSPASAACVKRLPQHDGCPRPARSVVSEEIAIARRQQELADEAIARARQEQQTAALAVAAAQRQIEEMKRQAARDIAEMKEHAAQREIEEMQRQAARDINEMKEHAAHEIEEMQKQAARAINEMKEHAAHEIDDQKKDAAKVAAGAVELQDFLTVKITQAKRSIEEASQHEQAADKQARETAAESDKARALQEAAKEQIMVTQEVRRKLVARFEDLLDGNACGLGERRSHTPGS
jgi:hypothetical protein